MKPAFTAKRKWFVAVLFLAVVATVIWHLLSRNSAGEVSARFLGYAFATPQLSLGSVFSADRTKQEGRIATFFITNGCDFTVHCSLSARYTNAFGGFSPREVSLEAHAATNITGLARPPRSTGAPLQGRSPSWTDWTNAWRLTIAYRKAPPLQGIEEMRYRTALWLIKRKQHRLSRVLNPVRIYATETEIIPPDLP